MATCGNCKNGQVVIGTKACSNCLGEGEYTIENADGSTTVVTCGRCGGSGDQEITAPCTVCKGTGNV